MQALHQIGSGLPLPGLQAAPRSVGASEVSFGDVLAQAARQLDALAGQRAPQALRGAEQTTVAQQRTEMTLHLLMQAQHELVAAFKEIKDLQI